MYGEEGLKGGMGSGPPGGGGGGGNPFQGGGVPGQGGAYTYSYHGDPRATFAEFFGTSNPFDIFFGNGGVPGPAGPGGVPGGGHMPEGMDIDLDSLLGGMGRGGGGGGQAPFRSHTFHSGGGGAPKRSQDPTIERDLPVSLEDIAKGVTKKMKISR